MTLLTKSSLFPRTSSLLDEFFNDERFLNPDWGRGWNRVPSANVIEKDDLFQIDLAAPGMKKTDFHVDIDNGQLTISSEQKDETEEKGEHYTRLEFSYNIFSRSFLLPESVNAEKIKAKYEDGILRLELPKKKEVKLKKKEIAIA